MKIDLFDIDIIGCSFGLYILLAKVSFMGFPLYLDFNVYQSSRKEYILS
jgi:hypothetical protein